MVLCRWMIVEWSEEHLEDGLGIQLGVYIVQGFELPSTVPVGCTGRGADYVLLGSRPI